MTELPEWLATMVGRLVIENEALRRALAETQAPTDEVNGPDAGDSA
jgi:hypothetical protein